MREHTCTHAIHIYIHVYLHISTQFFTFELVIRKKSISIAMETYDYCKIKKESFSNFFLYIYPQAGCLYGLSDVGYRLKSPKLSESHLSHVVEF